MAERRLCSLRRKLEKNPALKAQYAEGMRALLDEGFAERVPVKELGW